MSKAENTYFLMGTFFLKEEQFDLAVNAFSKAIEFEPDDSRSYNYRGIVQGRKGEYKESILDFTKAIQINDQDLGAYNNRGLSYYKLGVRF